MGTSTPFGGGNNKNPLIPSWLNDPSGSPGVAPAAPGTPPTAPPTAPGQPGPGKPGTQHQPTQPAGYAPGAPPLPRFTNARKAFNKGARSSDSGERTRSFGRAASNFISRSGGARGAAARASLDRSSASTLAQLLLRAGAEGSDIRQELRRLNLDSLAQRSTAEIFDALIDYVCEPGGDLDQAFVRDAYAEALDLVPDDMIDSLERPDAETIRFVLEHFITNTIMSRLLNAIANGAITIPETATSAVDLRDQFRDWIHGRVQDAMEATNGVFREGEVVAQINRIYEAAYSNLESSGDGEE